MDQKNEVHAVSAAAAFLIAALTVLEHSSEGLGIGMRNTITKELQRLGPDHAPKPFAKDQIRSLIAGEYGDEAAADIVDGKGQGSPEEVKAKDDVKELTSAVKDLLEANKKQGDELSKLRAELETARKEKPTA